MLYISIEDMGDGANLIHITIDYFLEIYNITYCSVTVTVMYLFQV